MVQILDDRRKEEEPREGGARLRAVVYDAEGSDREVPAERIGVGDADERQLVWVDATLDGDDVPGHVWDTLGLDPEAVRGVAKLSGRPGLEAFDGFFTLKVVVIADDGDEGFRPVDLLVCVSDRWVVTAHPAGFDLLDAFNRPLNGETKLGDLDGASFAATLLNWLLNGYFRELEDLEDEVDRLDEMLLTREVEEEELLAKLVRSRRRITRLRRTLTPHREVFTLLADPDADVFNPTGSSPNFQRLHDRMEKALQAADNAREMLIGSFDVFMTQTSQRTNEQVKALTVISVLLLPSVVLAGIMGMNFKVSLFDEPDLFWVVLGVMAGLAVAALGLARWRRWL